MTRNNRRWASYTLRAAPAGIKGVVMTLVASLLIGSAAVAQSQSATSPESDAESDGQPAIQDTNETATIERLEGEAWQLQEYLTVAGLKPAVSDTGNRYAEFSDGRFRLNAGCNTLNGSYWLDGSRLIFSPHVTSLLQDCTDTLMTQEQSLLRLLAKVERFGKRDGSMALMDAQGLVLMTLSRPDAVPLQGRLLASAGVPQLRRHGGDGAD